MSGWLDYATVFPGPHRSVTGRVLVLPGLASGELGNRRDVLVYLPPSYGSGVARRYPTLYFQDGQNLFDRTTSFGGVAWQVDETLERLAGEGIEAIAVGIVNAGAARIDEYAPVADRRGRGGRADAYLDFVAGTVKPQVDAAFRTAAGPERTGIVGSSLGGLVSLYALFARPDVFGLAAALSPSLGFARGAIFATIAAAPLVPARIYLDVGTREGAALARDRLLLGWPSRAYRNDVRRMRSLLEAKGYRPGSDLLYREEPGARHDEAAWARRLPGALRFLLAADR